MGMADNFYSVAPVYAVMSGLCKDFQINLAAGLYRSQVLFPVLLPDFDRSQTMTMRAVEGSMSF